MTQEETVAKKIGKHFLSFGDVITHFSYKFEKKTVLHIPYCKELSASLMTDVDTKRKKHRKGGKEILQQGFKTRIKAREAVRDDRNRKITNSFLVFSFLSLQRETL